MIKIAYLLVGTWIAVVGFLLANDKNFYFRGTKVGFGELNALIGYAFITIGISIFVISLFKKAKDFGDKFLICPTCKKPFNKIDLTDNRCPKCKVELEDLEGFYERHPELKAQ